MRDREELQELSVLAQKGGQPCFGVFYVWAHEFLRIVCICYVTLRHYHIGW